MTPDPIAMLAVPIVALLIGVTILIVAAFIWALAKGGG